MSAKLEKPTGYGKTESELSLKYMSSLINFSHTSSGHDVAIHYTWWEHMEDKHTVS